MQKTETDPLLAIAKDLVLIGQRMIAQRMIAQRMIAQRMIALVRSP